jgi:hypothetical protein
MVASGLSEMQKGASGLHNGEEESEKRELELLLAAWKEKMNTIIKQAAVVRFPREPLPLLMLFGISSLILPWFRRRVWST